jgi:anti-anti-sigma factor
MRVIMCLDEDSFASMSSWDDFADKLLRLVDAGFQEVVIDFRQIRRISSLALGTIVSSHQKMNAAGRTLAITNLSPELKEMFQGFKLLGLLSNCD